MQRGLFSAAVTLRVLDRRLLEIVVWAHLLFEIAYNQILTAKYRMTGCKEKKAFN